MLMFTHPGENRGTLRSQYEFLCFYVCISFPPEEKRAVVTKPSVYAWVCISPCVCFSRLIVPRCMWQNTAVFTNQITGFQLRSVCMSVFNVMKGETFHFLCVSLFSVLLYFFTCSLNLPHVLRFYILVCSQRSLKAKGKLAWNSWNTNMISKIKLSAQQLGIKKDNLSAQTNFGDWRGVFRQCLVDSSLSPEVVTNFPC